ncbi:hypothetical protein HN011_002836 [Eciton burchellii]|nr:hypothetical protein HN011_002836 [Eciton burchellii]
MPTCITWITLLRASRSEDHGHGRNALPAVAYCPHTRHFDSHWLAGGEVSCVKHGLRLRATGGYPGITFPPPTTAVHVASVKSVGELRTFA